MKNIINKCREWVLLFLMLIFGMTACGAELSQISEAEYEEAWKLERNEMSDASLSNMSDYTGAPFTVIDGNVPDFQEGEYITESFEYYSELDELGRCGVAYANIGTELMPTEERESIGRIKPSGWQLVKYDFVDGKYLYNRCHLIGFQLAGENDNERNLITGTRYMNVIGMLPFENQVADYVKETGNHVLYRVTPMYEGDNLVASGVQMEAWSVEDDGAGVCFNVYVYNHQPGIAIDYATGDSRIAEEIALAAVEDGGQKDGAATYVLNTNTMKFHYSTCSSVAEMKPKNKRETGMARELLLIYGYEPCGLCEP